MIYGMLFGKEITAGADIVHNIGSYHLVIDFEAAGNPPDIIHYLIIESEPYQ